MAATDVNARWQAEMADFFVDLGDDRPDEGIRAAGRDLSPRLSGSRCHENDGGTTS